MPVTAYSFDNIYVGVDLASDIGASNLRISEGYINEVFTSKVEATSGDLAVNAGGGIVFTANSINSLELQSSGVIRIKGNVYPDASGTRRLGHPSFQWSWVESDSYRNNGSPINCPDGVEIGSSSTPSLLVMYSPDGNEWDVTIDNSGVINTVEA